MREIITKLMFYNDQHVQELAVLIEAIEKAVTNKTITQTEYVDLMVDVERLKAVIQDAQDAALDKLVHDAVVQLIELAEKAW